MNGISHKQAIKLIHRRLDGLLTRAQGLLLDEHLNSCEACRAYASEIDLLPTYLQSEFHTRWDQQPGPSEKVFEHVKTKARRIRTLNRISSGIKLAAGVATLVALGFLINLVFSQLQGSSTSATATGTAVLPTQSNERLLAFASGQNGNFDIYTMHTDGSGLTNLTNNPAVDIDPFWSPDGKRIAFVSGRDGSAQIYLMDADGSNMVQLTKDEGAHAFANYPSDFGPWSPDGSKLIVTETLPGEEKWNLYIIDASGENKTLLVGESNIYNAVSWSPDGQHVAFLADDSQNLGGHRIYVVNVDGSDLREITKAFSPNEQLSMPDYYWSQDGQSIFFVAFFQKTNPYWTAYEARLEDGSLIEHATTTDMMYGWWDDIYMVNNFSASAPFEWVRPDGTSSTLNPTEKCEHIDLYQSDHTVKRSPNGNWVMTGQCANGDTWFYWANSDGTQIKPLLDSPISITDTFLLPISWSRDDKFVAFTASSSDQSDLYILSVSEALNDQAIQPVKISKSYGLSWQPIPGNEIVAEKPTPQPTQTLSDTGLIAFTASGEDNALDIYTIRTDGSGLTNLTNNSANDVTPVWSPDGKRIAFVSNRDGNENIYAMNADGSDLIQLTDVPASDTGPVWSPDSTKIAYISGNPSKKDLMIYVMDSNGKNHRPLNSYQYLPNLVWPAAWSPDSQFIYFYLGSEIAQVDANTALELGKFMPKVGVYASGFADPVEGFTIPGQDMAGPFALSKDGTKLLYLAECGQNSAEFCNRIKSVEEYRKNPETHETVQLQQVCRSIGYHQEIKWSPDRTKILFAFYCEETGGSFYIANADGSDFKLLTDDPNLLAGSGFDWSPDGQSVVFTSALENPENQDFYILNVNDALQNPELRPLPLNVSASQISSPSWQPVP